MNLARVVARFGTSYNVTRTGAATTYTDGKRVAPSTSTVAVTGVVQPVPGKDLDRLPEGLRDNDVCYFWTTTALQSGVGVEPDQVSIGGVLWQVEESRDWTGLGNYYRSLLRKA